MKIKTFKNIRLVLLYISIQISICQQCGQGLININPEPIKMEIPENIRKLASKTMHKFKIEYYYDIIESQIGENISGVVVTEELITQLKNIVIQQQII